MLSGRDIVIISSIEWRANWQGHQEIARRLAEAGNRVFYVENMGVRAPRLADAGRVVARAGLALLALSLVAASAPDAFAQRGAAPKDAAKSAQAPGSPCGY